MRADRLPVYSPQTRKQLTCRIVLGRLALEGLTGLVSKPVGSFRRRVRHGDNIACRHTSSAIARDAADIGRAPIRRFEAGRRTPIPNNLAAIRRALEDTGVEFRAGLNRRLRAVRAPKTTLAPAMGGGRLAQLVERFLYTEDVGGSSPSSPTTPLGFARLMQARDRSLLRIHRVGLWREWKLFAPPGF